MKRYLLDINIISYLADVESPFHGKVRERFKRLGGDDVVTISILGLYELHYGISKAGEAELAPGLLKTKRKVCASLPVVPLSEAGRGDVRESESAVSAGVRIGEKRPLAGYGRSADCEFGPGNRGGPGQP